MKKIFTLILFNMLASQVLPQSVAINTDGSQPNAGAMLDIKNANKGLLIPRVSLVSETDAVTIPSPVLSLLVFNTNAALPEGAGFYFWNGNNKWSKLATLSALNNASWGLAGNSAINPNNDFIGTTDNQPLVFKTNSILSGKIAQGINSVFFGQHAGEAVTTGVNNSFFGHQSGSSNNSGVDNVANGFRALNHNAIGNGNIAIGSDALFTNLNGSLNVANGYQALYSNTSGNQNVGIGYKALFTNTIGHDNIAAGYRCMYANTTGNHNIASGFLTLTSNTSGHDNIGTGQSALNANTTGDENIATGYQSLYLNTTGSYNIASGTYALNRNTTGNYNIAVGWQTLSNNTTGNNITAIGPLADVASSNLFNATVIGNTAIVSSSNTMSFGNSSVDRWAFGLSTTNANHAITVGSNGGNGNGAYLTQGGNWTNTSSRIKKENFINLNSDDLLQKISQLSIQKWKYKGTDEYHIGPVAEDFYAAFGLGTDDQGISTVDPAGIALAAIKELITENKKISKELLDLKNEIMILKEKSINKNLIEKKLFHH